MSKKTTKRKEQRRRQRRRQRVRQTRRNAWFPVMEEHADYIYNNYIDLVESVSANAIVRGDYIISAGCWTTAKKVGCVLPLKIDPTKVLIEFVGIGYMHIASNMKVPVIRHTKVMETLRAKRASAVISKCLEKNYIHIYDLLYKPPCGIMLKRMRRLHFQDDLMTL